MTLHYARSLKPLLMHPLSEAYSLELSHAFDTGVHCRVHGPNGVVAYWWHTPSQARDLATRLREYAWRAEAGEKA